MNLPCTPPREEAVDARSLHRALLHAPLEHLTAAETFLDRQLRQAAELPVDLPDTPAAWPQWLDARAARTARDYARYLAERHAGAPRRYFRNRAHALHFLRGVAPTKLVDGAWLYGVLGHAGDARLLPLLHTYLEELGRGVAASNHVLIYRHLLESLGCAGAAELSAEHYVQGAVQLALGCLAGQRLPELIGYNLGYELPPLHLLVTTWELQELGIDATYFRLHVTIDNASCGHARRALQALYNHLPDKPRRRAFLARVRAGMGLNDVGLSSTQVIDGFDLDRELLAMLERKQPFARHLHSDRTRIQGRTLNQWLAAPWGVAALLRALQQEGWIRRDADPAHSRFWRLVSGPDAAMFGVFDGYEQQLLHDWIAGSWSPPHAPGRRAPQPVVLEAAPADLDEEERRLRRELAQLAPHQRRRHLLPLLAPQRHWTPLGLLATRLFSQDLGVAP